MGVGNGLAYLQQELDAGLDIELAIVAVAIDRLALHVFGDQVGVAGGGDTAVQQAGDMVMS